MNSNSHPKQIGAFFDFDETLLDLDKTKRRLASELATHIGVELKYFYAHGNHQADLPLQESVGFPYVVEPTQPLRKVALARNWPILAHR